MSIQDTKILLLKAIVVTIPFGNFPLFSIPYTDLNFILIYLYLLLSGISFTKSFSFNLFKRYALPLLAIWLIMMSTYHLYPVNFDTNAESNLRQLIFLISFYTFALHDAKVMAAKDDELLWYLMVAVIGLLLAYLGGFSSIKESSGRMQIAGVNSNLVAMYCVVGVIILLDSLINQKAVIRKNWVRPASLILLIGFMGIIAQTGSRGGILILAAGLFVFFLSGIKLSIDKLISIVILGILSSIAIWEIASTTIMAERLSDINDDSRLIVIWPAALDLIKQYPIFGPGLAQMDAVLLFVTGARIAVHNEYLKIAAGSGLIGLCIFLLILMRFLHNALYYMRMTGSGLYMALLTVIVLFLGKGGGALLLPFIWVMFLVFSVPSKSLMKTASTPIS
jgi:O-antigen ligase